MLNERNIFYALVAVLVMATFWWVWVDVMTNGKQISAQEVELDKLREKFRELAEVDESYDVLKARFGSFLDRFDSLKTKVPDPSSFVKVMEDIREVAVKQNIEIKTQRPITEDSFPAIKTKLVFTGKHIERYPIQIHLLGDYLTIGAFLEELLELPYLVNIRKINIETELETGGVLSCELVLFAYVFLDNVKKL